MATEQDRQNMRAATVSRLVCQVMADLDQLVDRHCAGLSDDDAAAVRVFTRDARQPLEQLNAKLLRVTPPKRDDHATHA